MAAVHCVIIGFGLDVPPIKKLFDYETPDSEPKIISVKNINPYLVPGSDLTVIKRRNTLCNVPIMSYGSMANDGGHLTLSDKEKAELLSIEPDAEPFVHRYMGAREFIKDIPRWCLWLIDMQPNQLRRLKNIRNRIECVKRYRLVSKRITTQKLAQFPSLFAEIRQPSTTYIAVPKTSSERRPYIPIAFLNQDVIANTELFTLPDSTLYHFGILSSTMHMAWVRYTGGRLKSDYRYSAGVVYNSFPWPSNVSQKKKAGVESSTQMVLDVRKDFPESTLADLYDPISMPPTLRKAHHKLDKAVDLPCSCIKK
jgi:hypothetical protein